ncbi:MAG: polysaccharide deacetylase family protein [Acidobacteriota bacterium]|nr:polysaccharide deacetylase family protein [Acidobacteriota bacterium]
MRAVIAWILFGLAASAGRPGSAGAPARPAREVAVTFDDLPGVSVTRAGSPGDTAALVAMTSKLLRTLGDRHVPAVGFANTGKLGPAGSPAPERLAVLRSWRAAGLELGNHTFSHPDLHRAGLSAFERDVELGEPDLRALLAETGGRLRWFRHPFLHTGLSLDDKLALEGFLAGRGYRIAPVTFDNSEWIFARAYANALDSSSRALAGRVAAAYVPYMEAKFEYFERQSVAFFGREIRQILLVHANSLNADHFDEILAMLARRGYSLVTLDRALEDSAYATPDKYIANNGVTWLHRWVLSAGGRVLPGEPKTPSFVLAAAGVASE